MISESFTMDDDDDIRTVVVSFINLLMLFLYRNFIVKDRVRRFPRGGLKEIGK